MSRNKAWLRKLFAWAHEKDVTETAWIDKVNANQEYHDPVVVLFEQYDVAEKVELRVWEAVKAKAPELWLGCACATVNLADTDANIFTLFDTEPEMARILSQNTHVTAIQEYYDEHCDIIVLEYSQYESRGNVLRYLEQMERTKWYAVRDHAIENGQEVGGFDPAEVSIVDAQEQDERWEAALGHNHRYFNSTVTHAEDYYQRNMGWRGSWV